jgi:4-hydroxy-3-methylbut-2-en-1-yl diphosphate reductase
VAGARPARRISLAVMAASRVQRVLLASPRGFCAGVEMAIKARSWMVRIFDPPVYCYHEIVHNQLVVDRFRAMGVVFVDDMSDVPPGSPLMLSAHGTAPVVVAEARARGGVVIDAVCPLVTKVHHELKVRAAKGYTVLYVGHQGHDEAVGTMAVAPDAVRLVETESDVIALGLPPDAPVALLAQTTLSQHDWQGVLDAARDRYPELWMPGRSDLCFATTNRQDALAAIAPRSDAVVVIGSPNSSNTVALVKMAAAAGCPRIHRVNGVDELPSDLTGVVGVTAGASAPESLVREIVDHLAPVDGVEEVSAIDEDEYFPPPSELRHLLRGMLAGLSAGLGGQLEPGPLLAEDRDLSAADILARLG